MEVAWDKDIFQEIAWRNLPVESRGCEKKHHFLIHPPDNRNTKDPAVYPLIFLILVPFLARPHISRGQKHRSSLFARSLLDGNACYAG